MGDSEIHSYPKVWALGHPNVEDLFSGPVVVEEKVDGSQLSVAVVDGTLCFRSRNAQVLPEAPGMFDKAVEALSEIAGQLRPGAIYRGEYLRAPKHNTLQYERTPARHFVLWDIEDGRNQFATRARKVEEAERLGLEVAPLVHEGEVHSLDEMAKMLDTKSFLGGSKIEGLVFKNYYRFGRDGKILAGKHVSEVFKETNKKDWKKRHPSGGDIKEALGEYVRSEARWRKAIERLRDRGELTHSPKDIGALIREVQNDVAEECEADVKERLWSWARKDVVRKSTNGLAEWYKQQLAASQFGEGA